VTEIEVIHLRMDPRKWLHVETELQEISRDKGNKKFYRKTMHARYFLRVMISIYLNIC
jgi:hypothetical protein